MLDKTEALVLLGRAVREKGDSYVDPNADMDGCKYKDMETGEAQCVVGHVFAYLDWLNYIDDDALNQSTVDVLLAVNGFPSMDEDAVWVLQSAQRAQDGGATWGEALTSATEYHASLVNGVER